MSSSVYVAETSWHEASPIFPTKEGSKANFDLIVAMRNALPELLDLASRALTPSLAGGEVEKLCERLGATRDGVPFGWASSDGRSDIQTPKHVINPDGAEAAALIRSLTAAKDKAERERDELLVWKKRRQAEDEDAADCEDIW